MLIICFMCVYAEASCQLIWLSIKIVKKRELGCEWYQICRAAHVMLTDGVSWCLIIQRQVISSDFLQSCYHLDHNFLAEILYLRGTFLVFKYKYIKR